MVVSELQFARTRALEASTPRRHFSHVELVATEEAGLEKGSQCRFGLLVRAQSARVASGSSGLRGRSPLLRSSTFVVALVPSSQWADASFLAGGRPNLSSLLRSPMRASRRAPVSQESSVADFLSPSATSVVSQATGRRGGWGDVSRFEPDEEMGSESSITLGRAPASALVSRRLVH